MQPERNTATASPAHHCSNDTRPTEVFALLEISRFAKSNFLSPMFETQQTNCA
jgi:hypothetical protein